MTKVEEYLAKRAATMEYDTNLSREEAENSFRGNEEKVQGYTTEVMC
jgi:hypothetical protein